MKTLMINAHPDFKKEDSFSFKLKEMFLEAYGQLYPNEQLEVLNLYDIQLPRIEKNQLLNVWHKQREGEKLSEVEELISTKTSELLQQFKAYKRIVIISPLHNFNITSRLKDYIDNIMIARETFKYTENGSVGLMTDNYKALYLQASGSIYTNDDRYKLLDFSYHYLKAIFEDIMGFEEFYVVRAQGTAILPENDILNDAKLDLKQVLPSFYAK